MKEKESAAKPSAELANTLGYAFQNLGLLELACIHKSFGNEQRAAESVQTRDNERFEFLGDAILDLIVSKILLETYPESSEGDLSKMRAGLVNEKSLAKVAKSLNLGDYVWLGKGESQTGGREKDSILASTFEAVVAAVFLDGGFETAEAWVRGQFLERIKSPRESEAHHDYKTKLQELVQARHKSAPKYEVVQSTGPDHDRTFEVQLLVNGLVVSAAKGKSKKDAEQQAARLALEKYEQLAEK
ncbi:MAG: ribonuclease III [Bdellovibrionota bacterium]